VKSEILWKIGILVKNRNFGQKSKFWSKITRVRNLIECVAKKTYRKIVRRSWSPSRHFLSPVRLKNLVRVREMRGYTFGCVTPHMYPKNFWKFHLAPRPGQYLLAAVCGPSGRWNNKIEFYWLHRLRVCTRVGG